MKRLTKIIIGFFAVLAVTAQTAWAETTFILEASSTGFKPLNSVSVGPSKLTDRDFWKNLNITSETADLIEAEMSKLDGRKIAGEWGTPLHYAVKFGPAEAIPILIEAGADVGEQLHYDETMPWRFNLFEGEARGILHSAVLLEEEESQIAEKVQVLIAAGADRNASDSDDFTPLHSIVLIQSDKPTQRASEGMIRAMDELVEAGANINAVDQDGDTPLHLAFKYGNVDAVNFLLDKGADQTILNAEGLTPFDMVFKRYSANPLFTDGFYWKNFFKFSKNLKKITATDINS